MRRGGGPGFPREMSPREYNGCHSGTAQCRSRLAGVCGVGVPRKWSLGGVASGEAMEGETAKVKKLTRHPVRGPSGTDLKGLQPTISTHS